MKLCPRTLQEPFVSLSTSCCSMWKGGFLKAVSVKRVSVYKVMLQSHFPPHIPCVAIAFLSGIPPCELKCIRREENTTDPQVLQSQKSYRSNKCLFASRMPPPRLMKCHYEVLEAPRYVRREFKPPDDVLKRGRSQRKEEVKERESEWKWE